MMPDRFRPALGLAVALTALLLGGCGATTNTPSSTVSASGTKETTTARFIAQAGAICRTLTAREAPLRARQESLKRLPAPVADKSFVSLARQVVALSLAAETKLETLPRPAEDDGPIGKLLASYSSEVADASTIADAAVKEESTLGEDAEDALRKSIAATAPLAASLGMKECIDPE